MAGSVAERTRELGIRAALGAGRGAVVRLVLGQGLRLTAVGVALGLAGAAVAGRSMRALLYDVAPVDPITYAVAIALLVAVAVVASGVPAWRASRIDPSIPLRSE